jgi:hypothetical protein
MSLMRDLYYGDYIPCEQPPTERQIAVLNRLCEAEDALLAQLDEDAQSVYERLADCQRELSSLAQLDGFTQGVRFGVRFMLETMQEERGRA